MVYIPKQYRMDRDEAVQMMKSNPFALLITVDEQRPLATHIPLEIREDEGKIYATGHIAYGNMQKKTLDQNRDVLLVFQGPHAYISSSWYENEEVPTWDYLTVHAYGTARVLTSDELKSALAAMLERYESHRENGRLWDTFQPELLEREMKGIVGFEIAYLIYLGCRTLFSRSDQTASDVPQAPRKKLAKIFYESALVEVMNPKTALFFLAFFPQFISPSGGSVPLQFLLLGAIFIILAFISDGLYAILAASIRKRMKVSSKLQNRITGYLYIVLGVFSAFASPSKT